MTEAMTTSASGGMKATKLGRFDLLPVDALRQVAEHYGKGAEKYADHNYRKGYPWSLSYAALQRHANAFWGGETFDPETGSHHMAAVAFHALALITFTDEHPNYDDRYRGELEDEPAEDVFPKLAALMALPPMFEAEVPPVPKGLLDLGGKSVRVVRQPFRGDGSRLRLPQMGGTYRAETCWLPSGPDPDLDLDRGSFCVHYSCVEPVGD